MVLFATAKGRSSGRPTDRSICPWPPIPMVLPLRLSPEAKVKTLVSRSSLAPAMHGLLQDLFRPIGYEDARRPCRQYLGVDFVDAPLERCARRTERASDHQRRRTGVRRSAHRGRPGAPSQGPGTGLPGCPALPSHTAGGQGVPGDSDGREKSPKGALATGKC